MCASLVLLYVNGSDAKLANCAPYLHVCILTTSTIIMLFGPCWYPLPSFCYAAAELMPADPAKRARRWSGKWSRPIGG